MYIRDVKGLPLILLKLYAFYVGTCGVLVLIVVVVIVLTNVVITVCEQSLFSSTVLSKKKKKDLRRKIKKKIHKSRKEMQRFPPVLQIKNQNWLKS